MNLRNPLLTCAATAVVLVGSCIMATAQAPGIITYQGKITSNGTNFNGAGDFKFALVDGSGTDTFWSNDGTSAGGSEPAAAVSINVSNGLFAVGLGDTSLANMTQPVPSDIFETNSDVRVRVWFDDGSSGIQQLSPDQRVTSAGYALFANLAQSAAATAPDSVGDTEIKDGSVGLNDLDLPSVDGRYVEVAGDVMTGDLETPNLTVPGAVHTDDIINNSLVPFSLETGGDIEFLIDQLGTAISFFEVFNGASHQVFWVNENGEAYVDDSLSVNHKLAVGGTFSGLLDADTYFQLDLPNSVSLPNMRIASAGGANGFGIEFSNPDENWLVGPNIGNWPDDRFDILSDSSNSGIIIAPNGNVAIDGVASQLAFTKLTVNGSIGFKNPSVPALYVYETGTVNAPKPVISHSPTYPGYGLWYVDDGDRFEMKSSSGDTTPSLVVDLDSNWVTIATDTPKPGYELSVNGQIVCEELLVQDSASWPDYVFEEDYDLMPLKEVEAHIKADKRLPGIPSAETVAEEGISVGAMQKRMMEKIEELTLYVVQQDKKLEAQQARMDELEARLAN